MDKWYFNRLMTMSPPEMYYRMRRIIRDIIKKKFFYSHKSPPEKIIPRGNILDIQVDNSFNIPYSIKLFGTEFRFDRPSEIDWQKDFISGQSFKPEFYSKINIRTNSDLSAKIVWEVNRLQFLPAICINYKSGRRKEDLSLFIEIINSWSLKNPYLMGINWYSNIEINLRLITWFLCWEILDADNLMQEDPDFDKFTENCWLPLIKKHCIYSYENPSRYSSANNHLISEYAGLFIASSRWKFPESEKWVKYAHKGLEKEIIKQHSENGINREEAAEYIQFISDFFLLAFIVGQKTGRSFSDQYRRRLLKIFCYIYDLLDCKGNFAKYGDEDDGKCFIFDINGHFNNFRSLLTSGAILFNDPVFKSRSNGFDLKNQLLFGSKGKEFFDSLPGAENNEGSRFYPSEGHYFFRKADGKKEIFLHLDAAPLGFLSIAAHGHADALSFLLNVDGQPVLVDPGTFTYHTYPEWRNYFIGTLAHNTIRINGSDQAISGGPTMWIRHYKTEVLDIDLNNDTEHVTVTHNGYLRFGIRHIRTISFNILRNEFQILDTLIVNKERQFMVEIPFHIHPSIQLSQTADCFLLSSENSRDTELYVDDKLQPELLKGQIEPHILGWYSDSFLKKEPTNVIYCKTYIDCSTSFNFVIKIK
jgi:hypothetical protein